MNVLTFAAAAFLFATSAPRLTVAQAPAPAAACSLLTLDDIKTVIGSAVQPGQPSKEAGTNDCTWKDVKGQDRVYLSLKKAEDWKAFRDSMQATGRMTPVTGVAEDAFFVASSGNSAAFYTLKRGQVALLTVDGVGFSKPQNEASEKALAPHILDKL